MTELHGQSTLEDALSSDLEDCEWSSEDYLSLPSASDEEEEECLCPPQSSSTPIKYKSTNYPLLNESSKPVCSQRRYSLQQVQSETDGGIKQWHLFPVMKMSGCSEECCVTTVHGLTELDVLCAHMQQLQ